MLGCVVTFALCHKFFKLLHGNLEIAVELTLEQCTGKGCQATHSQKFAYNLTPPNLNSLLLTGSLSNNLNHKTFFVCCMYYIPYSYSKLRGKKMLLRKS